MVSITPIQIIALIFGLFALSRVFLRLKDGNLSRREFVFWTVIWVALLVFAFIPDITTSIAMKLGIERGMNLIASIGIILLFYLMFRLYIKVEGINQEITKIVRELAIEKEKGKKEIKKHNEQKERT
ncbi:MAG: DUF2304 family protein [Nanoarchaeota archaeon]|nr:DUF2304 family protein [Nanoarchaeota archaeon]